MNSKEKLTALLILYNDGEIVKTCLNSIKGIANEIFIIHDGPCKDNTLKICKRYTKNIHILTHKGRASLHMIYAFKNIKSDWILKLDADESLSDELKKEIPKLIQNPKADGYTFLWRWWDGKKYLTKNFPHKMALFRKSKVSFIEFPGKDEPEIIGRVIKSNLQLIHRPRKNKFTWHAFWTMGLKRAQDHAEYTLKNFNQLEKFQYQKKSFNIQTRLRRNFPLLSSIPLATAAFFKTLFNNNAWKEGKPVFLFAIKSFIYHAYVGFLIHKLK